MSPSQAPMQDNFVYGPADLVVVALFGIVLAGSLLMHGYWTYTPDDGFIHLTYIKNFAATGRFIFAGDSPSFGETSPLWVMVNAIFVSIGSDPIWTIKAVGFVFTWTTAVLALDLGRSLGLGRRFAALAGLLVITDEWLVRWAVSGLETSFAAAIILLVIVLTVRQRPIAAAVFAAFLPLVRPDLGLFTGLFGCVILARYGLTKTLVKVAICLIVPSLVWSLYARSEFGTIVPNTVIAKSLQYQEPVMSKLAAIGKILAPSHGLLLAVAGFATPLIFKRLRAHTGTSLALFLVAWPWLHIAAFAFTGSSVVSRYFVPASMVLIVMSVYFLANLSPKLATAAAALSVTITFAIAWVKIIPAVREYRDGYNTAAVQLTDQLNALTEKSDTVACAWDVGFLGYYNRTHYSILDLAGLTTREILTESAAHRTYFKSQRPRFLVVRSAERDFFDLDSPIKETGLPAQELRSMARLISSYDIGRPGVSSKNSEWYALYALDWSAQSH